MNTDRIPLSAGYRMIGGYTIDDVISTSGGTAILYRARDHKNMTFALKEFYPVGYCSREENGSITSPTNEKDKKIFEESKQMFEAEAKLLQSLKGAGSAPRFRQMFAENGTVYYVMEHLNGRTLKEYLKEIEGDAGAAMGIAKAVSLLDPIFCSLSELHAQNVIHRDIGPDNIFLCQNDHVRLIDFGNARVQEKGKSRIIDWAKRGYAPIEMFDDGFRQGTWTDIYAVAATLYRMITGEAPPNAEARAVRDELISPMDKGIEIPINQNAALMRALAVFPQDRYKDIAEFYRDLRGKGIYTGFLIGLDGEHSGEEIRLNPGQTITLGCNESCNVRFVRGTPGVSRMHGSIVWDEGGYALFTDENSTYGSRTLGGEPIEPCQPVRINEGEGFILGDDQVFALVRKLTQKN